MRDKHETLSCMKYSTEIFFDHVFLFIFIWPYKIIRIPAIKKYHKVH